MKTYIESMTKLWNKKYTIRVWREEKKANYNHDDNDCLADLVNNNLKWQMNKLAKELLKIDRVNAVEVLNKETGDGVVLYKTHEIKDLQGNKINVI